jgi:hypothetical protein
MINLVTGYRGTPHVTADEEAVKNLMTFEDFLVTENGEQLAYNIVSNNQIRINSSDIMAQGRLIRIEGYEDVVIETGTQGMNRKDLICLRYTKDGGTGIESVALVAIKGAESSGAAEAPAHNAGDILEGDNPVDFPLYAVTLEGLTVTAVTAQFTPSKKIHERIAEFQSDLDETNASIAATQESIAGKAPAYTYGTTDLTAGTSELATGTLHFVYE